MYIKGLLLLPAYLGGQGESVVARAVAADLPLFAASIVFSAMQSPVAKRGGGILPAT